ncbi:unnamed protein product [Parnassius mnemosyne]|uniref:ATP-dependent DNA helicase n=1 Tax=Parnassius mnemosyne TaxID=213953 RepID=A0AAV1KNB6_9NEOP
MGGVTVLLAGDFRQILPVVPKGTRAEEVKACLKRSTLWPLIKILKVSKNMRVHLGEKESAGGFANLLLEMGNGDYPINYLMITIPDNLCTVVFT